MTGYKGHLQGLIGRFYPVLLGRVGVVVIVSDFCLDDWRVGGLRLGWHVSLLCCVLSNAHGTETISLCTTRDSLVAILSTMLFPPTSH